jgi:hypothetical protein
MSEEVLRTERDHEAAYGRMLISAYSKQVPQDVQNWAKAIPGLASGELFARILGGLGHPRIAIPMRWEGSDLIPDGDPFERSVRQLWAYCGIGDPRLNPRKDILGRSPTREDILAGGKRTTIRPLLHTFTGYLVQSAGRSQAVRDSSYYLHYRVVKYLAAGNMELDDEIAAQLDGREPAPHLHQWQCQNRVIPPGKPNGCGTVAHPEWGAPGSPWRAGHVDAHAQRLTAKKFLEDLHEVSTI